ncbi:MAG TPA: single-stranded DNA-binding protein [Bacteroidales bacterium]|nr:single-stranded DNA-binding protein [Bacteroidales bacterium]
MSVNKVILVGNVGKDPETRYLEGGTAVSKFSMATSETYRNRDGEKITTTEWHNIVVWRGLAEVCEKYVRKGSQLYIEGRIRTRTYNDKDGNTKYFTEIVGDNMQMLGKRSDDTQENTSGAGSYQQESGNTSAPKRQAESPASDTGKDDTYDNLNEGTTDADDLPF